MKTDSITLQLSFRNAGTKEIWKEKRIKGFKFWNRVGTSAGTRKEGERWRYGVEKRAQVDVGIKIRKERIKEEANHEWDDMEYLAG